MYANPEKIKSNIVKVRLDDRVNEQINALVTLTGDQKAVLTRRLVLLGLQRLHESHVACSGAGVEGADQALLQA